MTRPWTRAALFAAGLVLAAPVLAQPAPPLPTRGIMPRQEDAIPGPMMGAAPGADMPGADPLQVLANSFQVQQDLGLNAHQLENLRLASRNFLTQMQDLLRPGVPPEQARAAIQQQMMQTRPMIARELTTEQMARLQQIMLQIQGPCTVVADPQAAAQLGLSGQRQAQAVAVCRERGEQMRAAFRPPPPGTDPCQAAAVNREHLMRIREESDARVLAVFTPEQRGGFARMAGRPLHLEPPMPPGCARPG